MTRPNICGKELIVTGSFARIAKLRAEYFEYLEDPDRYFAAARAAGLKADLFTFLQDLSDRQPHYNFYNEPETISALPITSYEHWWKSQLNGKTRNMIRKAEKAGVTVKIADFDDDLVRGIEGIYNESPLRQGKPFLHYRKPFEVLRAAHATYLDRSQFLCAYYEGTLIGFAKLYHGNNISSLMQIISRMSDRDKAPSNALIAKAVEVCAQKSIPYLHYGIWSRRSLGEFKKHHGFERYDIVRYFVPFTYIGQLALKAGIHRPVANRLPGHWQDVMTDMRANWYSWRYRKHSA